MSIVIEGVKLDEAQISVIKAALSEYAKQIREDGEDGALTTRDMAALKRIAEIIGLIRLGERR